MSCEWLNNDFVRAMLGRLLSEDCIAGSDACRVSNAMGEQAEKDGIA